MEDGFTAPKGKTSTWTTEQKEKCSANEQAKSLLYCAISQAEFEWVSTCKTAKDIWEKLQVT
ncbi:hypothetical protein, partial [Escherichia coli]|uniref:hypothetical protein n=1 Tax=Escherichia coli TaxID=562 RepID=UPI00403FB9A8